jgi:thiol-disulfide isomerase/thioredoxin
MTRGPRLSLAAWAVAAATISATAATAGGIAAWGPAIAKHEFRALDGGTASLADLQGDIVVLNFWASWCKPCKRELLELDEWSRSVAGAGVRVLAVSIDRDRARAERFVKTAGLTLPVYLDGPDGLARDLDLPSLPCTVVLDGAGRVVHVEQGGPESVSTLARAVEKLLGSRAAAGQEVSG